MKTIGFVDYYISEWHANNYPNWMKVACEKLGEDFQVKYAWAEKEVSEVDGKTTAEWCKERQIIQCNSVEELCEKADYILILAPSNPEKHLEYAKRVFPFGKPTFIDKTFAPDLATAKEIYRIADQYGVKFFSTSALRFAVETDGVKGECKAAFVTGPGKTVDEYIIHPIETMVKCMGVGAKKVKMQKNYDQLIFTIDYLDGRKASIFFHEFGGAPYSATVTDKEGKSVFCKVEQPFFPVMVESMINFFNTGVLPFEREQTFEVMKIRDGILKSMSNEETWIEL